MTESIALALAHHSHTLKTYRYTTQKIEEQKPPTNASRTHHDDDDDERRRRRTTTTKNDEIASNIQGDGPIVIDDDIFHAAVISFVVERQCRIGIPIIAHRHPQDDDDQYCNIDEGPPASSYSSSSSSDVA